MADKKEIFLETANLIGSQLCKQAFWSGLRCNWIGRTLDGMSLNNILLSNKALSPDVYEGTSGISLFLANLFQYTKNEEYKKTAEGAIQQAISRVEDIAPQFRFGFYSGKLGIAYVATKLGDTLKDDSLSKFALKTIQELATNIHDEHLMDIVSGNASSIPALLEMYRIFHEEKILELAVTLGNELVSTAVKEPYGLSWDFKANGLKSTLYNLTGFAHGAAGIGCAMLELFAKTDKKEYRYVADQAFQYENHWYDKQHENWPDFRTSDENVNVSKEKDKFNYAAGWCHGAPGIGLSRLRAYDILKDKKYLKDCQVALDFVSGIVKKSSASDQSNNFTLCHGLSGMGDILLYASKILNNDSYESLAREIGLQGIEKYVNSGLPWPCVQTGETPGLLLGLAGIGNFYLRLYDAVNVPTPLIIMHDDN